MTDHYHTIKNTSEGFYKEKGSKFLAFAFPVRNEEEIKAQQDALRKTYYDARHHCYAYILGAEQKDFRANDDGEPNHSAGDPILGQIRSKNLTNVLVIVVRYFGGTKLGVSGLINAYKVAAADALEKANIAEEFITGKLEVNYPYEATNEVMRLVKEFDLTFGEQHFGESCSVIFEIRQSEMARVRKGFEESLVEGIEVK